MATVIDEGNLLILKLSFWEKIGGFHKDLKVSKDNLIRKTVLADPWRAGVLKGVRAPGAAIPFVMLIGTMRYKGGKDFTAIYKRKPVVVYEFKDYNFKRWILTQ